MVFVVVIRVIICCCRRSQRWRYEDEEKKMHIFQAINWDGEKQRIKIHTVPWCRIKWNVNQIQSEAI